MTDLRKRALDELKNSSAHSSWIRKKAASMRLPEDLVRDLDGWGDRADNWVYDEEEREREADKRLKQLKQNPPRTLREALNMMETANEGASWGKPGASEAAAELSDWLSVLQHEREPGYTWHEPTDEERARNQADIDEMNTPQFHARALGLPAPTEEELADPEYVALLRDQFEDWAQELAERSRRQTLVDEEYDARTKKRKDKLEEYLRFGHPDW